MLWFLVDLLFLLSCGPWQAWLRSISGAPDTQQKLSGYQLKRWETRQEARKHLFLLQYPRGPTQASGLQGFCGGAR